MFQTTFFRTALFSVLMSASAFTFAAPPVFENTSVQLDQVITLSAGTNVTVYLNEQINAEDLSIGNAIDFTVRSNVTVNGKVLIAAGAPASGWVKKVKKVSNGECAEITVTVEEAQAVDGQMVRLRSTPHILKATCDGSEAILEIGTNLRANVLNDIQING